jgi:hypothetical protein
MAMSSIHSANRLAFANYAGITVEYSRDNGATWTSYSSINGDDKIKLVSGIGTHCYIGGRSSSNTASDKLRITLNATSMGVYTKMHKILINLSTNYAKGSTVKVEKAMKGSTSTFSTVGTYSVSGWSGWNSIPLSAPFGGGDTQTSNIAVLRFTFGITGVDSNTSRCSALDIQDIAIYGETYWSYPSTMAKNGHIYSYDYNQNVTFPATLNVNEGLYVQGDAHFSGETVYARALEVGNDNTTCISDGYIYADEIEAGNISEGGTALRNKYSVKGHKHSMAYNYNSSTGILTITATDLT